MSKINDSEGRDAPDDQRGADPVFLDSDGDAGWLSRQLGCRQANASEPDGANRRRPRVGVFRWCKRLVVGSMLMVLFLAAALIVAVWFSRGWLRMEGEKLLTAELARQRIHMDYGSASYVFTRGLVLNDVRLYETAEKDRLLLTCSEIGFSFDLVGLIQKRLTGGLTTSFTTRDATLVCYESGGVVATIEDFRLSVIGRPNDVLVEQFRGRIGDLDFNLEGQILSTRDQRRKRDQKEKDAALAGKPKTKKVADFAFFKALMPWLDVTSREEGVRPELQARFVVDHSAEAPVTVQGRFMGRQFNWRKVPLDSASVEFAFAEGDERLELPAFNLVYQGGLITGAAVWDSGTNIATVERFQSSAHILGLLRDINPKIAPFAATLKQDEPPLLNASGTLRIKDFWNSDLDVHYRHQTGMTVMIGQRPLLIEGINGRVHVGDGGFQTESLQANILGGAFTYRGKADLETADRTFQGTVDLAGLPLQAIVNHLGGSAELPGVLTGHFEGGGGFSLATMRGQGSLRLDAAKLYKVPVIGPVQNLMGSVVPVFGDADKRSELTATFTIGDGRLETRDLVILADGTRVEVGGTLNLTNWQTQFEAQGNLVGALGLVTGLLSKALVVEGSGRVDNLDLKLKHVPAEFASDAVRGVFDVAKGGIEGAHQAASGAIKATGNVLGEGADVVTGGVKAVGDGLGDGARMVGEGAKKLGEGLLKIIPRGGKGRDSAQPEPSAPQPQPGNE